MRHCGLSFSCTHEIDSLSFRKAATADLSWMCMGNHRPCRLMANAGTKSIGSADFQGPSFSRWSNTKTAGIAANDTIVVNCGSVRDSDDARRAGMKMGAYQVLFAFHGAREEADRCIDVVLTDVPLTHVFLYKSP